MESFLHGLNNQSNMYGDEAKVIPSKQRQNIPALSASQKPSAWLCAHILFYFWTRLQPNKFENEGCFQMDKSKPCFIRTID